MKKEGMITDLIIDNMMGWHHSGFNLYCGKTLWPGDEEGIENLARYIIIKHLGLWGTRNHDPPGENPAQTVEWIYDDDYAQPPFADEWAQ
jgi:hypothetical protein